MHDRDSLHRFMFENFPIRGQLVHVDAAWRALIEHREYPAAIRDTLGEAVAASLLLAGTIKFDGVLSLQLQGEGPVHLLLAQCTSGLGVRGLARYREAGSTPGADATSTAGPDAAPDATSTAGPDAAPDAGPDTAVDRLIGPGNLTVTLESADTTQRYQGIVPITGGRLAESLQLYFENSEQLPTRLWLHADAESACGLLLQRLPSAGGAAAASQSPALVDDAWRRVQLIAETLTPGELRTLADAEILHRLYHEDDVRLYESAPVYFRCRCSRERVSGMLQALGADETRAVLAERGAVEVQCDFCNRTYRFDAVDVEQLFARPGTGVTGGSVH